MILFHSDANELLSASHQIEKILLNTSFYCPIDRGRGLGVPLGGQLELELHHVALVGGIWQWTCPRSAECTGDCRLGSCSGHSRAELQGAGLGPPLQVAAGESCQSAKWRANKLPPGVRVAEIPRKQQS